ncbi:molybdenum cofactor guanylyltransferase MobA [Aliikangiella coralliicola]|uniref:Molybdenum cofactor guanylyltransferase n=1 Tax=Aliikangiella coralliicola TaxID=2592383 RepID=A0A545UDH3_9GAMM|nr:molybdenum cofactor guanylyltransferase MobA [Aliikangiella coralliicola]TQV87522.1 molybdenum cofactor guanylyltransferase [Aliikangiella coralliicola]
MLIGAEEITGLILAGGQGRRVDENDKGMLHYKNKPMIAYQVDWMCRQVDQVMISANRNLSDYLSYGFPVLIDAVANFPGPLAGIMKGLEQSSTEWVFVHPVDMPLMPEDTIHQLCASIAQKKSAYYLKSSERSHFLSLLISKSTCQDLVHFLGRGERRVRDFLKIIDAQPVNPGISEKCFANFNYLADYSN